MKSNQWQMCHKSLWTPRKDYQKHNIGGKDKLIYDIIKENLPLIPIGLKSIITCDLQLKCYEMKNKNMALVRAKRDQNGFILPTQSVKDFLSKVVPFEFSATAIDSKNYRYLHNAALFA